MITSLVPGLLVCSLVILTTGVNSDIPHISTWKTCFPDAHSAGGVKPQSQVDRKAAMTDYRNKMAAACKSATGDCKVLCKDMERGKERWAKWRACFPDVHSGPGRKRNRTEKAAKMTAACEKPKEDCVDFCKQMEKRKERWAKRKACFPDVHWGPGRKRNRTENAAKMTIACKNATGDCMDFCNERETRREMGAKPKPCFPDVHWGPGRKETWAENVAKIDAACKNATGHCVGFCQQREKRKERWAKWKACFSGVEWGPGQKGNVTENAAKIAAACKNATGDCVDICKKTKEHNELKTRFMACFPDGWKKEGGNQTKSSLCDTAKDEACRKVCSDMKKSWRNMTSGH